MIQLVVMRTRSVVSEIMLPAIRSPLFRCNTVVPARIAAGPAKMSMSAKLGSIRQGSKSG